MSSRPISDTEAKGAVGRGWRPVELPLGWLLVAMIGVWALLLALDAALTRGAATRGLFSLEFATEPASARTVVYAWREPGRLLAMLAIGLDGMFILLYGLVLWTLVDRVARSRAGRTWMFRGPGWWTVARTCVVGALILDVGVDGVMVAQLLRSVWAFEIARLVWLAGVTRFVLIGSVAAYLLLGLAAPRPASGPAPREQMLESEGGPFDELIRRRRDAGTIRGEQRGELA